MSIGFFNFFQKNLYLIKGAIIQEFLYALPRLRAGDIAGDRAALPRRRAPWRVPGWGIVPESRGRGEC